MEPEYERAPTYPIANRRFLCVEYPGFVKNIDRVLETLGGEKNISQVYGNRDNEQLELRYRPKDPFCHSINGSIVPSSQVLVKVTRRRRKNQPEDEGQLTTEIVGTIPHTCRFRGMADFQYLVPKTDPVRKLRSALLGGDAKTIQRFKVSLDDDTITGDLHGIPPPVFSTMEEPFKYGYKQNGPVVRVRVLQPDGTYVTKLVNRSKSREIRTTTIFFDTKDIPMSPPPLDELTGPVLEVKKKLEKLYEERPIWSRFALRCILGPDEKDHLPSVLPHHAYTFQNGPWRECWIKYGLDPRQDKRYAIYQQLDIRMNLALEGAPSYVRGKRTNPVAMLSSSYSKSNGGDNEQRSKKEKVRHIFDGQNLPSQSAWYQICDITDPDFACIFRTSTYLHSGPPTKRFGFFYPSAIETAKNALRLKLQQFSDKGQCNSILDMDNGLADKVKKDKEEMAKARGGPSTTMKRQGSGYAENDGDDFVVGDDDDDDDDDHGLYESDSGDDDL